MLTFYRYLEHVFLLKCLKVTVLSCDTAEQSALREHFLSTSEVQTGESPCFSQMRWRNKDTKKLQSDILDPKLCQFSIDAFSKISCLLVFLVKSLRNLMSTAEELQSQHHLLSTALWEPEKQENTPNFESNTARMGPLGTLQIKSLASGSDSLLEAPVYIQCVNSCAKRPQVCL